MTGTVGFLVFQGHSTAGSGGPLRDFLALHEG